MEGRIAVVGGGMLGMTLAYYLAGAGRDVTLFEAEDDLGGLLRNFRVGEICWDRYYHVILPTDLHLQRLLDELGLMHQVQWKRTRTGLLLDGQLYSVSSTAEFAALPALSLLEKLRLGMHLFYASRVRDWHRLERVTAVEWLRTWSGPRASARFWVPLLRAKLGEEYRCASAVFIWATMARLYGARRSGTKREKLGYVRGGYAVVIETMKAALRARGAKVACEHQLLHVQPEAQGGFLLQFANGARHRFQKVIFTVPNPNVRAICPWLPAGEQNRLAKARYMGIVCVAFLLRRPLAGFYVTNLADASFPFTGVIEMSSLVDANAFGGHAMVYLPKYVSENDSLFQASEVDVVDDFFDGLRRIFPELTLGDLAGWNVARHRYVFALPTLRYSEIAPPLTTSVQGLYIVNSAQIVSTTLNVNETVRQAQAALPVVLGEQ